MDLEPPAFLERDVAIAWLQCEAVKQARRKYGPSVRTSIGRSRDPRVLCNYLGLDQRRVLPLACRNLRHRADSAAGQNASARRS
jgi:hypothetical protein